MMISITITRMRERPARYRSVERAVVGDKVFHGDDDYDEPVGHSARASESARQLDIA